MASSSQHDRRREKMAQRQRGAGTHKVQNAGFGFEDLLPAVSNPFAPAPAFASVNDSLPQSQPVPNTEIDNALPVPPPLQPPRRTSPRSNGTVNSNGIRNGTSATPEPGAKRRRQPSPDKFLNTPDKAEIRASQQARGLGLNGERAKRFEQRMRGAGTHRVVAPGFDFTDLVQKAAKRRRATPERQPEASAVVPVEDERMEDGPVEKITTEVVMAPLNEPAPGPELEPEAELVPEAIVEPEPEPIGEPMELDEAPEEGPIAIGEEARRSPRTPEPRLPDVGPKTPPERPKRRSLGKKPLSPKIPIEEELEAEEAEREALRQGQLEAKAEAAREAEARRKAREKERARSREERALAENKARAEAEAVAEAKAKAARARARARAKEDAVPEPESEAEEEEGEEDAEFVVEEVVEDEFEGEEEAEEEAAPPPSKKRRPPVQKEARRAQADHAEEGDTARKSRRKGGIPVIVHRLAKSSDAPLPPKSNRKGPNPADIIFTLFSQLIDAAYEKLQTNTEKVAVENFKEELASRLRQLTDTIENLINLQARVRQENKRKLQLQKEILEVRRQRNLVAAQMDDVRHQHDVASKQNDILHRAGATFEEISNIVEQGNAKSAGMPDDHDDTLFGLEAMIHKVLPLVTGGGADGSGILSKVVEFNRDLERITEALREHNKAHGLI